MPTYKRPDGTTYQAWWPEDLENDVEILPGVTVTPKTPYKWLALAGLALWFVFRKK